jgi:hypothetical protein
MTSSQLQEYARFGAQARLQAIEEERSTIIDAFPDLGRASGRSNGASSTVTRRPKGRSPSQRKAVGERMKAYWAKRRGEKAGRASDTESASDGAASSASHPSKRKGMSPAARKAHGERMKAYWAARKSAKNGAAVAGGSSTRRNARKTNRKK